MHEGAVKKDGSVDAASSTDSSHENPEREAAVDALLATFGSKGPAPLDKPEPSPRQHRRDTLVERSDPGPRHNENHHRRPSLDQRTHRNNDDLRPAPPRVDRYISKRAYSPRREEFSRTDDRAHRSSEFPVRPDPRDYRGSGEHEKLPRIENHYRDERDRFEDHYSAGKGEVKIKGRAPTNAASERFQAPSVSDGRVDYRAPPRDELYKAPEAQREPPTKDGYDTPRSHRYPPPPMDTDYPSRDYGYAPPPTGRYLPPVDDPRYPPPPPATRGPEADYAAMYYRDLTEWLEITGYHDFSYRTIQLERHRALEASRHYGIPPDDPAYLARHPVPRDELDTRHSRGGPGFTMPPPPPVVGWDERNPPARPVSRGAGYPPPALTPKNRYSDMSPDKNSLKRRISLRDEDIREPPPHSTKAARHAYDDPYRRAASPDKDDKLGMRRSELGRNGNEPSEETDFARRTLAERIGRGRNASPGADSRRRSLSPRGYDSGYQGARRYEGEFRGRGRGRGYGRGGNNNDRDRRGSNGEEHPSPGRGRGFGRGRGRGRGGYGRDYHSPERVRYEQREGPSDDYLSGEPTLHFQITWRSSVSCRSTK